MKTVDNSKRVFVQAVGVTVAMISSGGVLRPAQADPFIIGSLLGAVAASVLGGIYALTAKSQEGRNSIELERKRMVMQKVDYLFGALPVNEQLALMQNGAYYNALVSDNIDGFSSMLEIRDGKLMVTRGQYGGQVHSDMAIKMGVVMNETGVAPVPIQYLRASENDRIVQAGTEFLADKQNMSVDEYRRKKPVKQITTMSLAKNPRSGGEDFAFFTSLNKNEPINIGGRNAYAVAVNPVPSRILV